MAKYKVVNSRRRIIDAGAEIKKAWGPEFNKPDVVYRFNGGKREFLSTNHTESGIYKRD